MTTLRLSAWQRFLLAHEFERNPKARVAFVSVEGAMTGKRTLGRRYDCIMPDDIERPLPRCLSAKNSYHPVVHPDGSITFTEPGTYWITVDDMRPPPRVDFRLSTDTLCALAGRAELAPPSRFLFDYIADNIRAMSTGAHVGNQETP